MIDLAVPPAGAKRVNLVPMDLTRRLARRLAQVPTEEIAVMQAGLSAWVARSELLFDEG